MKSKKRFLLWLLVAVSYSNLFSQNNVSEKSLQVIRSQEIYDTVKSLASEKYAGRFLNHPGYIEAAKWVAASFKKWGLKPYDPKTGFLHPYKTSYTLQDEVEVALLVPEAEKGASYKERELKFETDYLPVISSGNGSGTAEIVFCGYGISEPELGYDDYANVDVNGKFVLILSGAPNVKDDDLKRKLSISRRQYAKTALSKGAKGVLNVRSPAPIMTPGGEYFENLCAYQISEKIADALLESKGTTYNDLKKDIALYRSPVSFPLDVKIKYTSKSRHFPEGDSYNIIGYVEGSDPELKKEALMLFAHMDHFGPQAGRLFAGANDNASGTAIVMELAKAFGKLDKKPKRSVIFIVYTAEEFGLGPDYFLGKLPKQFTKVDGYFHYDMVGVGDYVDLSVEALPAEMKTYLLKADKSSKIVRSVKNTIGSNMKRDYPYLYFASGGGHTVYPEYHKSTDNIYRINPDILYEIARISFLTYLPWADR